MYVIWLHTCVHAWAARVNLRACSSGVRHWVFEKVSYLPSWSAWLANEPQWSDCLCLLDSELISTCHQTQPSVRVLRIKTKSCYLQNKHFTYRGIYLAPEGRQLTLPGSERTGLHRGPLEQLKSTEHRKSPLESSKDFSSREKQRHTTASWDWSF